MATPPTLGYGQQTEASIDSVNQWMRSTPWYQEMLRQWGHDPARPGDLTKTQRDQVLQKAQSQGVVVDQGDMEIDTHGNFNPKGHKLRNTLIVAGIAGATLATMGAAGAFAGAGAAGGAGTGAGGGALASSTIGSGAIGGITGGTGLAAGTGAGLSAGGALASTAIGGGVAPTIAGGAGMASGGGGLLAGLGRFAGSPQGASTLAGIFGTVYGNRAQNAAAEDQLAYLREKDAQERADQLAATEEARRQFDQTQALNLDQYNQREARLAPYRSAGASANSTLAGWLGLPVSNAYTPAVMPGSAPAAPAVDPEARAKFDAIFPDDPSGRTTLTPDMVKAKEAELKAAGFTLRPNARGTVGKIQYGSGPIIDIIQGAESGANLKQWLPPQATAALTGAPMRQSIVPSFSEELRPTAAPSTLGGMLGIAPAAQPVDPTTLYALLNTPRRRTAFL